MIITKFESYYNQITENLIDIKEEQEYQNLSNAFAHWFLKSYFKLDEQEIQEAIVDGHGDNGIDAIIHNESDEELIVLQFKFPSTNTVLNKEIEQADILKTINGFKALIGKNEPINANQKFIEHRENLKDKEIYNFRLMFISFNKGIVSNLEVLENFKNEFVEDYGGDMAIEIFDKKKVSNVYEKINRKSSIKVKFKYKLIQQAYNLPENNINSYLSVVNGKELIESLKDDLLVIFDENIRLYEKKSPINDKIKETASSDESNMFYFYNNGIVFICNKAEVSPNKLSVKLNGASIVNGCQTINSLADLNSVNKLKEDVDILVRIIEINDYDQRAKITEYLNSQTPIKDSYFISNHTIVRELQKNLLEKGYYLERQINETEYKKKYGEKINKNLKIIKLENTIQYYVAYWDNKNASLAKRGKGALFNSDKIEGFLKDINAEKVIEAHEMYDKISKVITMYRKMRRNKNNTEFADFLKTTNEYIENNINKYLYLNTGDILLLNATRNLKNKYQELNIEFDDIKLIKDSIEICGEIIKEKDTTSTASLTKNATIFQSVVQYINDME